MARRLQITLADAGLRRRLYRLRHGIFATELGQHAENAEGTLSDPIDDFNIYIAALRGDAILGFISVTPPGHRYSFEKYFARDEWPFAAGDDLYEIRLLSMVREHRGGMAAAFLMYAALRWIDERGGRRVAALGRREVLDIYLRVGLASYDRTVQSGKVTYVLLSNTVEAMLRHIAEQPCLSWIVGRALRTADWRLGEPPQRGI